MHILKTLKEVLAGIWKAQKASLIEPLRKTMIHNNDVLTFVILGDLLGYPFQSTFYSKLIWVHLFKRIPSWRRRLLKERDLLDKITE